MQDLTEAAAYAKKAGAHIIGSLWGDPEWMAEKAAEMEKNGLSGVELDIGCPHLDGIHANENVGKEVGNFHISNIGRALAPLTETYKVPIVAAYLEDACVLSDNGPYRYVFMAQPSASQQATVMADYARISHFSPSRNCGYLCRAEGVRKRRHEMSSYYLSIFTFVGISIIGVLGTYLVTGLTGMFSLGQSTLMAVGAYCAGIAVVKAGLPVPVAFIIAISLNYLARVLEYVQPSGRHITSIANC